MTEPPNGNSVRISNREIYDILQRLRDEVADLKRVVAAASSTDAETRARVRSLELRFYGILAGLIGAIVILLRVGGMT